MHTDTAKAAHRSQHLLRCVTNRRTGRTASLACLVAQLLTSLARRLGDTLACSARSRSLSDPERAPQAQRAATHFSASPEVVFCSSSSERFSSGLQSKVASVPHTQGPRQPGATSNAALQRGGAQRGAPRAPKGADQCRNRSHLSSPLFTLLARSVNRLLPRLSSPPLACRAWSSRRRRQRAEQATCRCHTPACVQHAQRCSPRGAWKRHAEADGATKVRRTALRPPPPSAW